MTSATTQPFQGMRGHRAEGQGYGLALFASVLLAAGMLAGNQMARRFAVAGLGLNAIGQMLFIPAYPFWSLTIIAMDVVAFSGLCVKEVLT